MAITTQVPEPDVEVSEADENAPRPFVWTRSLYQRLGEVGIFHEDDPVELIEGQLIRKAPKTPPHSVATGVSSDVLREVFRPGFHVQVHSPLGLGDHSEPEPDLAVVPGSPRDYGDDHPGNAALAVEVAESSLGFDREYKASLYARFNIPEYWIVNLQERILEVHREPAPDRTAVYGASYTRRVIREADASITPLAAPDHPVRVADLLP
jgi:Uma2 family endonuclease